MEWYWMLLIILGGFIVLIAIGMPVALSFLFISLVAAVTTWGGEGGLTNLILNLSIQLSTFTLLAIPLFVMMGEILFQSGLAIKMIDTVDKWLGKLPGRLGLVSVSAGGILATLTGASMSSCAILGSTVTPEMEKRGYKKSMSLGPIMGSAGLAIMIPPSALAVYMAALAEVSVGRLLVAIVMPGLMLGLLYAAYIISACVIRPDIAPSYEIDPTPLSQKLVATVKYILPVGFIIFLVTGVILIGIATPSEAAATGALGTFIFVAAYGKLNWETTKKALWGSLGITVMIFTILAGAMVYSQVLVFSGASRGLAQAIIGLNVSPMVIHILIQIFGVLLGMFMNPAAVMSVIIPLFLPIINALAIDPLVFSVVLLINVEMATISPPFGNNLFVMKAVAPKDTTMGQVYKAALPFCAIDLIGMALVMAFPIICLWLPNATR
ncbi:TRAP transporter large permease subunit [Chloroflexota bacterium]